MPDPRPHPKGPLLKKAQEAKNLLGLGQGPSPQPDLTQLTPGLTEREVALLREPARQFGRYVALDEVGRGGMGIVYRAWDTRLRRVVALKMAAQTDVQGTTRTMGDGAPTSDRLVRIDPALLDRLEREAQAASRLSHPNLIRVLDAGIHDGIFYFTMDLVSGVSVSEMAVPMREVDALRLVAKLARGVAHAHKQGVLHRDIKPSNIIVSELGEPVLIDFGLAKDLAAPSATVTGDVFGTPCYMAPEQAKGDPRAINHLSDIYGLGATLYHLVTGMPPYGGLEPAQVLLAVLSNPPYPPSTLNPMVSPRTDQAIRRAMERAPEARYQDADAFAAEIESILGLRTDIDATGRTVVLAEAETARRPAPLPARAWLAWGWVLGVASAILLGVGVALWKTDLRNPAPPRSNGDTPVAPPTSAPPGDPGTTPAPPGPSVPPMGPPRAVPPIRLDFDATARFRPTAPPAVPVDPSRRQVEPPPAVDPPAPEADSPAPEDPDASLPAEARDTLQAAQAALTAALVVPLTDGAAEVRATLGGVVALADQAAAQAPSWSKPKRLRGDALLALGLYADAAKAYEEYVPLCASPVVPAEALLAEFLEWFRRARPWAEEVTSQAAEDGKALADRLEQAAAAQELEVSPFVPWRPAAAIDAAAGLAGARGDLSAMASMARQDWARASEEARAVAGKGGLATYVAELMRWLVVDGVHPSALLVEMADRRVRCAEPWLLASWGLVWKADFEGAERASVRALEARDVGTPEVAHQLGVIAYCKGDHERAKNEWSAALGADPTRRAYHVDVGALCLLRGEFVEAEERLKEAIAKGTSDDPVTDRMRSFAEYELAMNDVRRIAEVEPRPKKKERDKLYADAVSRMRSCLAAADEWSEGMDKTGQTPPRTYFEWSENGVRDWVRADPWAQGLRADAGTWKQIEALIR